MRGSCARTCSNGQEQISLEVLQSLESELDSRPRTIIFTVMRFYLFVVWFPAGHAANVCANFAELFMATFYGVFSFAICFPPVPLVVVIFCFLDSTELDT